MIKKLILIVLILFVCALASFAYAPCLKKGALIKVYSKVMYSTADLEEGSGVYFIAPADIWVLEHKVISEGDIFYGYVSMLKMPVQGVNAALSIVISTVKKKTGEVYPIEGKIIFESSKDVLGGDLTNPLSYNTTIHPRKVYGNNWGGTLQYVPSGEYEFGQHMTITPRDSIFIELTDDFYI